MLVRIHDLAIEEIAHEVHRYERLASGLGHALEVDVAAALALIERYPRMAPIERHRPEQRAVPLERFPFTMPYEIRADDVVVLALAPRRRKPGYWRSRLA